MWVESIVCIVSVVFLGHSVQWTPQDHWLRHWCNVFQQSSLCCPMSSVTCVKSSGRRCCTKAPGHVSSQLLLKSSSTILITEFLSVLPVCWYCSMCLVYVWLISRGCLHYIRVLVGFKILAFSASVLLVLVSRMAFVENSVIAICRGLQILKLCDGAQPVCVTGLLFWSYYWLG